MTRRVRRPLSPGGGPVSNITKSAPEQTGDVIEDSVQFGGYIALQDGTVFTDPGQKVALAFSDSSDQDRFMVDGLAIDAEITIDRMALRRNANDVRVINSVVADGTVYNVEPVYADEMTVTYGEDGADVYVNFGPHAVTMGGHKHSNQ